MLLMSLDLVCSGLQLAHRICQSDRRRRDGQEALHPRHELFQSYRYVLRRLRSWDSQDELDSLEEASYSCLQSWAFSVIGAFPVGSSICQSDRRRRDGQEALHPRHELFQSIDMSFVDSGAGIVKMSWTLLEEASYSCLQILGFLGDGFPEINRRMLLMSLDFDGDVMVKRLSIHVMSSSSLIDGSFVDSGAGIVKISWALLEKTREPAS
ncbi:hypothetical protein L596_029390 [Steinernema carpocapsae]|uniref:Uncharacterized protein n=1 Tax=Steinernema carpocapsae TaxID=34508 RepID=A0A4U5LUH7_STECR|nr:hypothetical protein L596_029390 [Steinernema carpocapsae]